MKIETQIPKNIKEQQAMDYALYEMATSMFKKTIDDKTMLRDRITLAWREISRTKQYEAEDKILAILDKSPLASEELDAENKIAKVRIVLSKDKTHYGLKLTGDDFDIYLEVNPYYNKKKGYKQYLLTYENSYSEY